MKSYLLIGVMLFLMTNIGLAQSKDVYKNQRFFNITKIGYINVQNAQLESFTAGEGVRSDDLNTEQAKAYSLQTIVGYFINPYLSLGLALDLTAITYRILIPCHYL